MKQVWLVAPIQSPRSLALAIEVERPTMRRGFLVCRTRAIDSEVRLDSFESVGRGAKGASDRFGRETDVDSKNLKRPRRVPRVKARRQSRGTPET